MSADYKNEELYITGESLKQPFRYFTYKDVVHLEKNMEELIQTLKKGTLQ